VHRPCNEDRRRIGWRDILELSCVPGGGDESMLRASERKIFFSSLLGEDASVATKLIGRRGKRPGKITATSRLRCARSRVVATIAPFGRPNRRLPR